MPASQQGFDPLCEFWESNPSPLQHQVPLNPEGTLKPLSIILKDLVCDNGRETIPQGSFPTDIIKNTTIVSERKDTYSASV